MVLTRDVGGAAQSGREKTLSGILACLRNLGDVFEFRVENVLEDSRPLRWLYVMACALGGWLRGRPEPLQSLLFRDPRTLDALVAYIRRQQPTAVYFDSIRSAYFAISIRKLFPSLRLVTDLDDLMSRRYAELRQTGFEVSIGYLERYLPSWVRQHVLNGLLRGLVLRYEAWALSGLEDRVIDAVDAVTLVSTVEVELLRRRLPSQNQTKIQWIPPSHRFAASRIAPKLPPRFVFIGSDSLLQNRLTIEWLLRTWQRLEPQLPLHIFGRMLRSYPAVTGVHFEGFADSLSSVYTPTSIMLAPAFLAGGIKTKLVEALATGVLAIGNTCSFEGLGLGNCRLALSESEIERFICDPEPYLEDLAQVATDVQKHLREALRDTVIQERWASMLEVLPPAPIPVAPLDGTRHLRP